MSDVEPVRLSVIIVTFNSSDAVQKTLPSLVGQLGPQDELVVVDNASTDGTVKAIAELAPGAVLMPNTVNEGFAAACNAGADAASGDLLVFLNPDAVPEPNFCEAVRRPLIDRRDWEAWMGLVTSAGGRLVNTSGGTVHFTGIAWAGEAGRPVAEVAATPHEVAFASGACLAVPRDTWHRHSGFSRSFFMYCEDVDLSMRMRLAGGRLGIEPDARVDHEYEFEKGYVKWRMLERNRWATIIRTYPGALLALLLPALLATEMALVAVSLTGGWGREKLLATFDTVRGLPRLLRERRVIQANRRISSAEFASWLTADLSSAYLGAAARSTLLRRVLRGYWSLVVMLLGSADAR